MRAENTRPGHARRGRLRGRALLAGAVIASLGVGVLVARMDGEPASGGIVFTQLPPGAAAPTGSTGTGGREQRYPSGSRIVSFDRRKPEAGVRILTRDFHSARAPALSPDGTRMVFSGQRRDGGPWQIWEMELGRGRASLVVAREGATDPAYLADGRIAFSAPADGPSSSVGASTPDDGAEGRHALFTAGPGDAEPIRVTFHPGDDAAPTVLRDGRLLFVTRESAASRVSRLMTMRSDGTAAELFYQNRPGGRPDGRAWEMSDDRVVFVETIEAGASDPGASGGRLVGVSAHRPLHSRNDLGSGVGGAFHSVTPLSSGEFLVSHRPSGSERYGLYALDPAAGRLIPILAPDPAYDAIEPVAAVARPAPKRFESVVDPQRDTGELYCLNADHSDLPAKVPPIAPVPAVSSVSVRIRTATGTLGEVPLEEDGSFYVELPADTPVRLETLDAAGRVVRGPSAWIWVRPNERRGCIGCHEDRELAPENRVPLAVEKPPQEVGR